MANSTDVRAGLQVFLQKKASTTLRNTLFNVMPLLEFFFALSGDKNGSEGLGRPKSIPTGPNAGANGVMIGALNGVANAQRAKIFAERIYLPIVQTSKPNASDEKPMQDYDNDPSVPGWEGQSPLSRFTQPRVKFCRAKMPYKIPHSDVRTARDSATTEGMAVKAIRSVYEAETRTRMALHCQNWNGKIWGTYTPTGGTAGQPTNEDATTWDNIHSLQNAIHDSNTYCGVDRTVSSNAYWKGNRITASDTNTFEDRINYCNYDLGFADKGMGVQLIVVGKTQFKKAKAEAKAESYWMSSQGIPEFPEFGFKREVIRIYSGNRPVYIVYDPECPSGHGAFLDPSTWTFAVHPDSNFKISKPADQTLVEGGDEADTGTIVTEALLVCEVPSCNAYFTNLG